MPQEFFNVVNAVTGGRARVLQSRLAHLNDDWSVVEDEPAPKPKKRAEKPTETTPPEPGQPDTDSPTDPAPKEY